MEEQKKWENGKPGKSEGQKLKSLLVIQYILKHADADHAVTIGDIQNHLSKYGIEAERRSIYRDIYALLDLLNAELDADTTIPDRDRLKYEITHTRKPYPNADHGGYLVTSRPYKFADLQLLTECVNSARFISDNQAKNLRRAISGFCSIHEAKQLNSDSRVVNRSKTINTSVMKSIRTISDAISHGRQISFKYLSYSFNNLHTQVERREGKAYIVNPFYMLIDNGYYYLMTYNGKRVWNYRIDRMRDVKRLETPSSL